MDELEDKILNQPDFSKKYLKHYLSAYTLPEDYSSLGSQMIEAKCRTKNQVDLVVDCFIENGGNTVSYIPTILYRFFFEQSKWVVPGNKNPFVD